MTQIEWTHRPGTKGESWNFIGGCSKVSDGCTNCWALAMSWRLQNNPKRPERYNGVVMRDSRTDGWRVNPANVGENELCWTGRVNLDYDALEIPYRWRKPRTVFVASMADLFHEKVPDEFILEVFRVMAETPEHTYLVLTKRAQRMHEFFHGDEFQSVVDDFLGWPPPNVWLGITAENQEQADLRIPYLLQTPAAVRWISVEPMLSPVNLGLMGTARKKWGHGYAPIGELLHWIVVGAESGPNRRRLMNVHVHSLITQCDAAGAKVFVKQLHKSGYRMELSKDPSEWPPELRRREWPR